MKDGRRTDRETGGGLLGKFSSDTKQGVELLQGTVSNEGQPEPRTFVFGRYRCRAAVERGDLSEGITGAVITDSVEIVIED